MRILDIIMEAPPPSGPVPPGMKWNGSMWVPSTTASPMSQRKKKRPAKGVKNPINRKRTPPPDTPESSKIPARQVDSWDKIKERWSSTAQKQRYAEYVNGRTTVWINRMGGLVKRLLKAAGLIMPIYTLYDELAKWEKDFIDIAEPFTGEDETDLAIYNSHRNWMWGKFMATEGAIIATRSLAWVLRSIVWTKFARRLLMAISTGATFGVGLAASIATEAGILWFSNWLSSPEGEKWWKNSIIEPYIRAGGFAADTAWQGLVMAYTKFTKGTAQTSGDIAQNKRIEKDKDPNRPNKEKRDANQTGQGARPVVPTKPPEEQSKTNWPSNIRNWSNGGWTVGGTEVTDGQGNLYPGIENVLAVQGARREAQRRGLPDPLADLPARPGSKHPGPFVD